MRQAPFRFCFSWVEKERGGKCTKKRYSSYYCKRRDLATSRKEETKKLFPLILRKSSDDECVQSTAG